MGIVWKEIYTLKFENKNRDKKKKFVKIFMCILFAFFLYFVVSSVNDIFCCFKRCGAEKIVNIPQRSSTIKIAQILKKEGIISKPFTFFIYANLTNSKNLKSGNFKLKQNTTYSDVVKILSNANNNICKEKIIILEGMSFFDIKEKFRDSLSIDIDDIVEEINDEKNFSKYSFVNKFPKDKFNKVYFPMEGLVFPFTFPVYEDSTPKTIANDILKKSDEEMKRIEKVFGEYLEKSNMELWDVFTLASIIQKETSDKDNMYKVSSVFHNRLNLKSYKKLVSLKKLESDVTRIYSEKMPYEIGQNYNTYKIEGLPVGPICVPSLEAIKAALNPDKTNFYFFYANHKTGDILYSENFDRHKKNISVR